MTETFSIERRKVMRALGAKVILTPAADRSIGMALKAEELAKKHGWLLARQFETEANAAYHARTTGPEILEAFAGKRLDYWVTGYGSGGTFHGTGKTIKQARPDTKIILAEPSAAPIITSGIKQERKDEWGAPASVHPAWTAHGITGWGGNFVPQVMEGALEMKLHDEIVLVDEQDAIDTAHALMKNEGIFSGISGGATMKAALEVCAKAPKGSVVLGMIPDSADRYLSTPLFAEINAEMDDCEIEIAKSTPSAQLLA